jgi:UrcA family protein
VNSSTLLAPSITAFAIFGVLVSGGIAAAQEPEVVTVVAPYHIMQKQVARGTIGAPIEEISLIQQVSFHDLDLKKTSDVAELRDRVKEAAKQGCAMLNQQYPVAKWIDTNRHCIVSATDGAMTQVDAAVAAANK